MAGTDIDFHDVERFAQPARVLRDPMSSVVDRLDAGEEALPLPMFFADASLVIWIAVMYGARLIRSAKFQP